MMYRPELAAMRESIRSFLLQVKYAENQTLPQFNIGAQFGVTSTAGAIICNPSFGTPPPGVINNCTVPTSTLPPPNGIQLPFKGRYPSRWTGSGDSAGTTTRLSSISSVR